MVAAACVALIGLTGPAQAQGVSVDAPKVIVRLPLPLDYEANSEALSGALSVASERTVTVSGGDTLSKIISKQYKVGDTNAPVAYALFAEKVRALNGITAGDLLKRGQELRVPDLPKLALTSPGANPLNRIPKLAVDAKLLSGAFAAPSEGLVVTEFGRPAAQDAVLLQEMTVEEAKAVLAANGLATIESADVAVTFEQAGTVGTHYAIPISEAAVIQTKLAGAAKQKPVLIVLDDSWPDDEAFRQSRDFFVATISQLRQRYKIDGKGFSGALTGAAGTAWRSAVPHVTPHAQHIAAALAPFQALEPADGRVKVIYLPMFTRQNGAGELIEHLITLNQTVQDRHRAFEDKMPKDVVAASRAVAARIVAKLDAKPAESRETDVALIQAVFWFCAAYSAEARSACIVNLSWITPPFWFEPRMPEGYHGELVAAAGNSGSGGGDTLYTKKWQFASRSRPTPADVLAVMNIDDAGQPACDSTVFGSQLRDRFIVGFDGAVAPKVCGTSFAAPRVAWLLAAREAMLPPPADASEWRDQMVSDIKANYDPAGSDYNRVRLSIPKFMAKIP